MNHASYCCLFFSVANASCGSISGEAAVTVWVGTPPQPGVCIASPPSGVVMQDYFSVNCQGFMDEELPLHFAFFVDTEGGSGNVGQSIVDVQASHTNAQWSGKKCFCSRSGKSQGTLVVMAVFWFFEGTCLKLAFQE